MTVVLRDISEQRHRASGASAAFAPGGTRTSRALESMAHKVASGALGRFGCDAAAVLVVLGRDVVADVATHPDAARSGALQIEWGEGPAPDAVLGHSNSVVSDLRVESRWRFWGPQAAQLGWRSLMTVGFAFEDARVALTLYSRQPGSFVAYDLASASSFGRHGTAPLARCCDQTVHDHAVSA